MAPFKFNVCAKKHMVSQVHIEEAQMILKQWQFFVS